MMADPNVLIPFYDDLDLLKRVVKSVPDDLTVFAVDGRYQHFPGETCLTDGAEEWCADQPNVRYCPPPEDQRPWGADRPDLPPKVRYDQHAETAYVNYELLPQDEWVLKLDTDERLVHLDRDELEDCDPQMKYTPYMKSPTRGRLYSHRVYVPEYWTFWVDDVSFPRDFYSRHTSVVELARTQMDTMQNRSNHGGVLEGCVVYNEEADRPSEYLKRRQEHLRSMCREGRAEELDPLVDRD